ncbi:MAG: 2-dehydropantoate 2-reductase [Dysgonamonadaceae bacterium]|jgi:2-dehydropantoate 2-reductase|nr:2-dehydropantoate 2-reductase [Dysgonamonadaceae bacterium]
MKQTKYLIAGTGGVGGSIAGFLALNGHDVTCIARGTHLETIRSKGLKLVSTLKGEHVIPVKAFSTETYQGKADVIFVCVKAYSVDSVAGLIQKASHKDTLVIPVLNVYGTGKRIEQLAPGVRALDGCIYIVGFISGMGEITQLGKVFRVIFGARKGQHIPQKRLEDIRTDLLNSGISAIHSDDINRDTFIKWAFISAMACTGAYFDVPMRPLQKPGEERDVFAGLSNESAAIGRKAGIAISGDQTARNLEVIDALDPESTASMQKDLAKGHPSEINELLFNMIQLAQENEIETPTYNKIAKKLLPL